jgi:hypothetical protein
MDQHFIRLMAKAYVTDNDLSQEDQVELAENAIDAMQLLKEESYELYNMVHSYTRAKQQSFLYRLYDFEYIDIDDEEELSQEMDMPSLLTTGGMLGLLAGGVIITYFLERHFFKYVAKIREVWSSIRTRISDFAQDKKFATRMKVINAILEENFDNCSRKCGAEDDIKGYKYDKKRLREALYVKANKSIMGFSPGMSLSKDELETSGCLLNCYLGYLTSVFAELVLAYDACLNKTGESRQFGLDKGIDVITHFPVGGECGVMQKKLKDTYDDFEDALSSFFEGEKRLKQEWINRLDQKIRDAKQGKHTKPDIMMASLSFEPKNIRH